jgi:hypothetical protein
VFGYRGDWCFSSGLRKVIEGSDDEVGVEFFSTEGVCLRPHVGIVGAFTHAKIRRGETKATWGEVPQSW